MNLMKKSSRYSGKGIYEGNEPYVFISYAHEDDQAMKDIKSLFENFGIRYWYDQGLHSGDDWNSVIAERLFKSSACVVLLSPTSVKSVYVKNELSFAIAHEVPVHALKVKEFDIPIDIEIMTGSTQRIDDSKNYEQKLIDSLSEDVHSGKGHRMSFMMFRTLKKLKKILKIFSKALIALVVILAIATLFSDSSDGVPTVDKSSAVIPSFSDFADVDSREKKNKGEEITYLYTLDNSVESAETRELIDEYINLLTTEYSYRYLGEKIFDSDMKSEWYWFEYTGAEFVTDRTGVFQDGTKMGSHDVAINIWNAEDRTHFKIYTSQEIEEVNNGEVFKNK